MNGQPSRSTTRTLPLALMVCALLPFPVSGQDRLEVMPGYSDHLKLQQQLGAARPLLVSGAVQLGGGGGGALAWSADSKGFDYGWNGKRYHFDVATRKTTELSGQSTPASRSPTPSATPGVAPRPCSLEPLEPNGRTAVIPSPDGRFHAIARNRNVFMADAECANLAPVTTDGNEQARISYGTTPWVYGEELRQTSGMWWNRTGTRLAYYRFDESRVPDFYITRDATRLRTALDVEAYPLAGGPNPVPDLFVYDLATKHSTRIDIRDGQPFSNDVIGHYAASVAWSPDGKELLVTRLNRRQNVSEFVACSPATGHCRVIIREEWPTGWVNWTRDNLHFLRDSTRFIWESVRNGFTNGYLSDLSGKSIAAITRNQFELASIVRIDDNTNTMWYLARDGDNFMKLQLHKVGLDGRNDRRLTNPAFNHQVEVSPDGKYFVDVAQTHDQPPFSQVVDVASTRPVAQLARSDYRALDSLGFRSSEMFSYLAADGKTQLFGTIEYPAHFDPARKYPAVAWVYGGPNAPANLPTENFGVPSGLSFDSYGFLVLSLHTRASPGLGKRTRDAIYLKLGQPEIDDMAAGVRSLWGRPYFDKEHVGIAGISYGGYASLMGILRYPDVFAAAVVNSPVTDWRNYDTIYAERYMGLPEENQDGYDKGSPMSYVANLRGELLLYYGTADDNVHSSNTLQLIQALQRARKHFEVQVGPDQGHTAVNGNRMLEFLIQSLVVKPRYGLAY